MPRPRKQFFAIRDKLSKLGKWNPKSKTADKKEERPSTSHADQRPYTSKQPSYKTHKQPIKSIKKDKIPKPADPDPQTDRTKGKYKPSVQLERPGPSKQTRIKEYAVGFEEVTPSDPDFEAINKEFERVEQEIHSKGEQIKHQFLR